MKVEQFEDKGLSHYSYAVLSESEHKIVLIDPSRNIKPYMDFAAEYKAEIIGVIETHPHADFVSGHLEIQQETNAVIYCSRLLGAEYPHQTFDEGDTIEFGNIKLKALNTPGHSPDSISIVLEYNGTDTAVFTGDTLFIGDCGRPDLREEVGNLTVRREELARQMYYSLREKLLPLADDLWLYPAHGAGSLCGKALGEVNRSTMGAEKTNNWSLQDMSELQFINSLLEDQPFVPKYFAYDVVLNKKGTVNLQTSLTAIPIGKPSEFNNNIIVVDARPEKVFKADHLSGSINIQNGLKFETWLGSILSPGEAFYLVAENDQVLTDLIGKTAKIGYELYIEAAFTFSSGNEQIATLDLEDFKLHPEQYTVVDIRNIGEVIAQPIFDRAVHIPLAELRERISEIPINKPIVVHCAGGYRSAAGTSILNNQFKEKTGVYDLGEAVKSFT